MIGPVTLRVGAQRWPLAAPFQIAGRTWEVIDVVVVNLEKAGIVGRGEALGVHYRGETTTRMIQQMQSVRAQIEKGLGREALLTLLPPGGARNAVDCALWDLESQLTGAPAWSLAGLEGPPQPLLTTYTCGADEPHRMAERAHSYLNARAIKLKLTGQPVDAARVRAVREARPDVWLGVDANQGLDRAALDRLLPILIEASVELIEQPFPVGAEKLLEGLRSPIPIAADESAQSLADLPGLVGRFDVVNIKLDKCGGLTEGLAMARAMRELGLQPMVGNMLGTSLAMAPAFILGQLCTVVDLDGPILLQGDRDVTARYADGLIYCPAAVWGGGQ